MKWKIIITFIVISVYLVLSPVIVGIEYSSSQRDKYEQERICYSISNWHTESFNYYVLFSLYKSTLTKNSFEFSIYDSDKIIQNFKIVKMKANIDGEPFILKSASNNILVLDRSDFNGYAGKSGVASYRLDLPKVPSDKLTIQIEGIAYYDNGDLIENTVTIEQNIESKKFIIPLILYLLRDFFR